MSVTVLDSADLVQSVITGVIPVPKGVAEDNASQAAKMAAREDKPIIGEPEKAPEKPAEPAKPTEEPTEGEDDVEGEDGLTPRQKRDFTKSMLATIARKHRAQRDAEELATSEYNRGRLAEQRNETLTRELARLKEQLQPPPAEEAKAPARADFETDQAFQDAVIDYRVDQRLKAQVAADVKRLEEQQQQEMIQHAAARIERAIELVPDFKEATEAVDMAVPPHIARYMQGSEMFAELGYHFAKHPEVLQKLTEFTANIRVGSEKYVDAITRSLVEVGKIESKLSPFSKEKVKNGEDVIEEPSRSNGTEPSTQTGTSPSKPRVQAPIIRPLNAGSGAQVGKSPEDMSTSETITAWQRKHGVKLTARKRH